LRWFPLSNSRLVVCRRCNYPDQYKGRFHLDYKRMRQDIHFQPYRLRPLWPSPLREQGWATRTLIFLWHFDSTYGLLLSLNVSILNVSILVLQKQPHPHFSFSTYSTFSRQKQQKSTTFFSFQRAPSMFTRVTTHIFQDGLNKWLSPVFPHVQFTPEFPHQ
jgi:hypothetical protein